MQETAIDIGQIHSLTDFLRNSKAHIANLKASKAPEVLTVNGRAEVVVLDAQSYQDLVDRIKHMESVATIRQIVEHAKKPNETLSTHEFKKRTKIVDELTDEAERLGLYR